MTITKDYFEGGSGGYAPNNKDKTTDAVCVTDETKTFPVTWYSNQIMLGRDAMQWQKSGSYLYNKTNLRNITKIEITSSAGTYTENYGTLENPSGGFEEGCGFFKITNSSSNAGYTSKVEITFTVYEEDPYPLLTIDNPEGGSIQVFDSERSPVVSGTRFEEGTKLYVSATAEDGYNFARWNPSVGSVEEEGSDYVYTMPGEDATLSAVFAPAHIEPDQEFTVTYYISGDKTEATRLYGETLSLDAPDAVYGMDFAGWSKTDDMTAPEFVENTMTVTEDMTLYAMFLAEAGEQAYVKVTQTADVTDGQYLIVYESGKVALDGSRESSNMDAVNNTISVVILENQIEVTEDIDASSFNIIVSDGTGSIQNKSGVYIGHKNSSNTLNTDADKYFAHKISITTEGNAEMLCDDYSMRYNSASDQLRFRYYKSGQKDIQLYKKQAVGTPIYSLALPETVTPAGFSSYYNDKSVKVMGAEAYYVSNVKNGTAYMTQFEGNVIPANTGALIKEQAGTEFTIVDTADEGVAPEVNYLYGSVSEEEVTAKDDYSYFIIGRVKDGDDYRYGFFIPGALQTGNSFMNQAHKAYIEVETAKVNGDASAKGLGVVWGEETAVNGVKAVSDSNAPVYNLSGQRVNANYQGIVIVNGKKVLNK